MVICLLVALFCLWPWFVDVPEIFAQSPPACTHYASPTGTGVACTQGSPCRVQTWTGSSSLAQAGRVLCLNDGTYTASSQGTILVGAGISGTAGNPITVRALNDGAVTLDAEHGYFAVLLEVGNNYWHIWGIDAKNGYEAIWRVKGDHNRLYRAIGYTGTSGRDDSNAFFFGGPGIDNMCIDCAGWGMNMRKMFESSQSTASGGNQQFSGCTRCWFQWNDHPQGTSNPNDAVQAGYRARQQRFHNVITSWNELGNNGELEGNFTTFFDCDRSDNSMSNTEIYGSLNYVLATDTFNAANLYNNWCVSDLKIQDMLNVVQSGAHAGVKPHYFGRLTGFTESGNTCTRCVGVHNGTAGTVDANTGWTFSPAMRQGTSLSAALSGASVWTELPGLCYRYEDGTLTSTPLWPWPMNDRIIAARAASGHTSVDVTATVESLLGSIPAACSSTVSNPPTVSLTSPVVFQTVEGTITLTATASDDNAVAGVQFKVDGVNIGSEDTSDPYAVSWDTRTVPDGTHELTAVARDEQSQTTTSAPITITVANGAAIIPPQRVGPHGPFKIPPAPPRLWGLTPMEIPRTPVPAQPAPGSELPLSSSTQPLRR